MKNENISNDEYVYEFRGKSRKTPFCQQQEHVQNFQRTAISFQYRSTLWSIRSALNPSFEVGEGKKLPDDNDGGSFLGCDRRMQVSGRKIFSKFVEKRKHWFTEAHLSPYETTAMQYGAESRGTTL